MKKLNGLALWEIQFRTIIETSTRGRHTSHRFMHVIAPTMEEAMRSVTEAHEADVTFLSIQKRNKLDTVLIAEGVLDGEG